MKRLTTPPRRGSGLDRSRRLLPCAEAMECRVLLAATITVNSVADTNDPDDGAVTLREAILIANGDRAAGASEAGQITGTVGTGAADRDTIAFNIPGAGVQTFTPASAFPIITDPVIIDGYTQPGSQANTNPVSAASNAILLIELSGRGLVITAGDSAVRGLVINSGGADLGIVLRTNGGNTIAGNYIGTNPAGTVALRNIEGIVVESSNNVIGGTNPADRNVISGSDAANIILLGPTFATDPPITNIVIQGNFIGTDATGTIGLVGLQRIAGINIGDRVESVTIGGTAAGARNLISGGSAGIAMFNPGPGNHLIQGNFIGTDVTGTVALGNRIGITTQRDNVTIGGTAAGAGNVISGNLRNGIILGSSGNVVQGNFIGTDPTGTIDLGNGSEPGGGLTAGILVSGFPGNNTIGGTAAGAGNVIVFTRATVGGNDGHGVLVSNQGSIGNSILVNSIFGNAGPGIGVEVGLPAPPIPVLTAASSTSITGTLAGAPNTTFRIEFFATPNAGQTGAARLQGETFLGTIDVTTDGAGNAGFSFDPPGGVPAGQLLTATATGPNGNTSEFSPAFLSSGEAASADLAVTTFADAPDPVSVGQDLTYTIIVTNNGPDPATGVVLTNFPLPQGVTFVSTSAGAFEPEGNRVVAPLGDLAAGQSSTVTIVVRPTAAAAGTTLVNTVGVMATEADPNPANNLTQVATTTVLPATPGGDTTGPTVVGLQRFGFHAQTTALVLSFSEALNASRATDVTRYTLLHPGHDHRFGTADDRAIPIVAASLFDGRVTLSPAERLSLQTRYLLVVDGGPDGLTDLSGNLLDGDGDGQPGGDHVRTVTRADLVIPPSNTQGLSRLAALREARRQQMTALLEQRRLRPVTSTLTGKRAVSSRVAAPIPSAVDHLLAARALEVPAWARLRARALRD